METKAYFINDYGETPEFFSSVKEIEEKYPKPVSFNALYIDNSTEYFNYTKLEEKGLIRRVVQSDEALKLWAEKEVERTESYLKSLNLQPGQCITGSVGFTSIESALRYAERHLKNQFHWNLNK